MCWEVPLTIICILFDWGALLCCCWICVCDFAVFASSSQKLLHISELREEFALEIAVIPQFHRLPNVFSTAYIQTRHSSP